MQKQLSCCPGSAAGSGWEWPRERRARRGALCNGGSGRWMATSSRVWAGTGTGDRAGHRGQGPAGQGREPGTGPGNRGQGRAPGTGPTRTGPGNRGQGRAPGTGPTRTGPGNRGQGRAPGTGPTRTGPGTGDRAHRDGAHRERAGQPGTGPAGPGRAPGQGPPGRGRAPGTGPTGRGPGNRGRAPGQGRATGAGHRDRAGQPGPGTGDTHITGHGSGTCACQALPAVCGVCGRMPAGQFPRCRAIPALQGLLWPPPAAPGTTGAAKSIPGAGNASSSLLLHLCVGLGLKIHFTAKIEMAKMVLGQRSSLSLQDKQF
ncbi:uncharacterized protein [Taeniopygia guttata]|uniref:uncharacterized protein isoform X2 n=1 Tax=Taeniopygia guttata TaxID=59729 RepID=UPI003BB882CF